ncbi:MAG: PIN domain-containing protein [Candidatus Competibacter denitrificans]|jgi:predicted nucleic acid-binding protein
MNDEIWFIDTNVLVYLFDADAPVKKAMAERVLRESKAIRLSTQVLQEFYVTVTRKLGRPLSPQHALEAVQYFQTYPVATISSALVTRSIQRSIEAQLSLWDSLIVETALAERADRLVTEDLQDGWTLGTMRIWNPFHS